MINFIDGQINIGEKNLLAIYDKDLSALAGDGLVEKREDSGGTYYYVEAVEDGMKFGIFISLRKEKVEWLRLHWLDSPIKGWNDVSAEAIKNEYRLLSDFIENTVGIPPENKGNRIRTWRFKWGELNVCYELRAFQADIFMKPK